VDQTTSRTNERRRERTHELTGMERLPFEILFARTDELLPDIGIARFQTYFKHHADVPGANPPKLEPRDNQQGSFVIYAKCRLEGVILGSIRIQSNANRPLDLELINPIVLPGNFYGQHLAFISRFSVVKSEVASLVRDALLKASMMYCDAIQAHHWVLTAEEVTSRLYHRIGFSISKNAEGRSIESDAPFPIYVSVATKRDFETALSTKNARLHKFIFESFHPDIKIFDSIAGMWQVPRKTD
jgi:hypothetical protein